MQLQLEVLSLLAAYFVFVILFAVSMVARAFEEKKPHKLLTFRLSWEREGFEQKRQICRSLEARRAGDFHDKNITFNVLSTRIRIDENKINAVWKITETE